MGDATEGLAMHRILYLDSSEGVFGGGQISLLELLANMNREKYHPVVFVGEEGKLEKEIKKLGVECTILPMPSLKRFNPFLFFTWHWRFFNYARKNKVELIHSNTSRATFYAGAAAKFLGIPLIWHVRVPLSDVLLDRLLLSFSFRVIAVSQAVKKRFDRFKKDKVEVIYNGLDTKKFSNGAKQDDVRRKLQINSKDILIGTVGRLSPEKGLEHLISAMRNVVRVYPQTKILLVGNGNKKYRVYLQEKVNALLLSEYIIFAGFSEDILQILRCMDIFCLPSLFEGFNRSLLEAMACGLPVVATGVGGNSEIVQDGVNGLLVEPCKPESLSSALIELLKDREKARKMGLEGRRIVEKNFSIEKNVNKIERLYSQIVE
jgi:glycosyltransferase involved in cell wall biosynthesis